MRRRRRIRRSVRGALLLSVLLSGMVGGMLLGGEGLRSARAAPRKAAAKKTIKNPSAGGKQRVVKRVVATAYCLGPCRQCETRGRPYLGVPSARGVAVARRGRRQAVPLGSRVYVPGYGWARVDDVGGGVGASQIDVRFKSHQRAKEWGRRTLRVVAVIPER